MTHKKFILFIAVVLLLSSSAFACVDPPGSISVIDQGQGFSIGAYNVAERFGGVGSAEGGNMVMARKHTILLPARPLFRKKQQY